MEILRRDWMKYIENLSKADDKAAELITDYLSEHSILSDEGFQKFVDYYYAVVTKYAEGASEMAAQAYEILAEVQGATIKSAEPAETPTYGECMKTIRGTMLDSDQAKSLAQSAGRLVRRTGVDTTINNALRDGAEWAWVPNGDTCAFCMMLASNGWQRASKKAIKNGHASHIHANCDCTYAIRFDGKSTVEGYDPDYYKALYDNAEGTRWHDKLNSMRRAKYAANPEKYRLQKRIAYRARNINETHDNYKNDSRITIRKGSEPLRLTAVAASTIKEKVKSGEYSLRYTWNQYNKHVFGHKSYIQYLEDRNKKGYGPQSRLTISFEEAQKIVEKQHGTGIIKVRKDNTPMNIEWITCDKIIGEYYDKGKWHKTNKAAIHYGKGGAHLVPHKGNKYD